MAKKYYWLKLMNDFFAQPKIKKLRRIAGGDTYTIIYLKMQLVSLQNDGVLRFEHIEDDFIEEVALTIDEDSDNVAVTMNFLIQQGLIEQIGEDEYMMTETQKLIGSETAGAERVRRFRAKEKEQKALLGNADVTKCNTEIEIEKEKEIETDKELLHKQPKRKVFKPPTVDEVREYCQQRNNTVDAERFIDYYSTGGWFLRKGVKMKDWKAAVRTWERNENERTGNKRPQGTQRHSDEDYTKGLEGFRGWDD